MHHGAVCFVRVIVEQTGTRYDKDQPVRSLLVSIVLN